jgi:hypothetical protein
MTQAALDILDQYGRRMEIDDFIEDLRDYFFNKAKNAFKFLVLEEFERPFLIACAELDYTISKFNCSCAGKQIHKHFIVWIPHPKTPTKRLITKISEVLEYNNEEDQNTKERYLMRWRKIKSRTELLDTVLDIQTVRTGRDCYSDFGGFKVSKPILDKEMAGPEKEDSSLEKYRHLTKKEILALIVD